jgi:RNA polymerase sigma-70 factor (ECF subfamily)
MDVARPDRKELSERALSYADPLYNLARYLTGNASDAEDLVQESFTRALASFEQFAAGGNLKAWLFRILRNAFIDRRRREKRAPIQGGLDTVHPDPELEAAPIELLRGDAELEHLRSVVARELEEAMMALPEAHREVILLDVEGFTESEVAEVLGCAVGTVKSRLSRARGALRRRLHDYRR